MAEGHEVLVIERDAAKCERIAEELGDIVLKGDGCEAATMETGGVRARRHGDRGDGRRRGQSRSRARSRR